MNDDLEKLLKTWTPAVPGPADFRRNVWRRIEASRTSPGFAIFEWLARPRIAVATLAVAAAVGIFAGLEISASFQGQDYLRSVNPYALVR